MNHNYTIQKYTGNLEGFKATCECGYEMTSTEHFTVRNNAEAHKAYMAKKAKKS